MKLHKYQDPLAEFEAPEGIGDYLTSYMFEGHLVDVHLFQSARGVEAFVVKSGGVPVATAQQVAAEALAQHGKGATRVVYDGYSLGR